MITDLDDSLKKLLVQKVPLNGEVDVAFDMPNKEWAASVSKPTVSLYLYDMHENRDLRENDWMVQRHNGNATKRKPPVRVALCYMVTVWTQSVEDEHRLLWRVLATLMKHSPLPEEVLEGDLRSLDTPVRTEVAQPEIMAMNASDFWSTLETPAKPIISYQVTLPLDLDQAFVSPLVFTKLLRIRDASGAPLDELVQVAGRVRSANEGGGPIAGARVSLRDRGLSSVTDEQGRFSFHQVPVGRQVLRVEPLEGRTIEQEVMVPSERYDVRI